MHGAPPPGTPGPAAAAIHRSTQLALQPTNPPTGDMGAHRRQHGHQTHHRTGEHLSLDGRGRKRDPRFSSPLAACSGTDSTPKSAGIPRSVRCVTLYKGATGLLAIGGQIAIHSPDGARQQVRAAAPSHCAVPLRCGQMPARDGAANLPHHPPAASAGLKQHHSLLGQQAGTPSHCAFTPCRMPLCAPGTVLARALVAIGPARAFRPGGKHSGQRASPDPMDSSALRVHHRT